MQTRKTIMIVLGVLLIVFGAICLAKGGIPYKDKHSVDLAIVKFSGTTSEVWEIHPVISGLAIAAGAVLVFVGARTK